jgi:chromosome partitioning protein
MVSGAVSAGTAGGLGWPAVRAAGRLRSHSRAVTVTGPVSRETEDWDGHPLFESSASAVVAAPTVVAAPESQRDESRWAGDLERSESREESVKATESTGSGPQLDAAAAMETAAGRGQPAGPVEKLAGDSWRAPSVDNGRPSESQDGSMIAGSYPGAEGAQAEGEDQVAIPSAPDRSADTPIARAAQAAMNARASNAPWPRPRSCRILTIANQKGGVGKTTTAVNLAASLAMHGSRVLVVDLDPQGNASTALDVDHRSGTQSIYNVLVDGRPLADVVRPVEGFPLLQCAPATIDLAGAEIELVPLVAREARLSRAVAEYDASNLDYIFIDCPPSLGLLTVNALVAAPEVLIPIQCEYYALEGLEQLLRTVDLVRNHLNPGLKVSTILLTMFDSRTRLATQVADEVRSHFGEMVLSSIIPRSVRVSEAPSYGQSVMTYDPGSSGALAYLEAAREMAFKSVASV